MFGIHVATIGRIGSEPALKFTASAKAVLSFSLGVSENRAGADGSETTWLRISCWEELAEEFAERLQKGDECYIEGRLKQTSWTSRDGEAKTGLNVSAWKVEQLGAIGHRAPKREREDGDGRLTQFAALTAMKGE